MHVIVWEKPVGGVFVVGAAEIVFIFCQCPCNGKAGSVCSLQAEIGVVPSHPVYQSSTWYARRIDSPSVNSVP